MNYLQALLDPAYWQAANERAQGLLGEPVKRLNQFAGLLSGAVTPREFGLLRSNQLAESMQPENALGTMSGLLAPVVYHGSPHKFDKFDMSKIGSGEGAQAYGHGLYFAENPNVAGAYKTALSRSEIRDAQGGLLYSPPEKGNYSEVTTPENRAMSALQYAHDAQSSAPYQLAANVLRRTDDRAGADAAMKVLADWQERGAVPVPSGSLYKVNIPDEAAANMLHWDLPLSQQPLPVRKFAERVLAPEIAAAKSHAPGWGDLSAPYDPMQTLTGADLMQRLRPNGNLSPANVLGGGGPEVSAALKAAGIPGIKYLDQGSRGAGQGTYNYVIFDDQLPQIMSRE